MCTSAHHPTIDRQTDRETERQRDREHDKPQTHSKYTPAAVAVAWPCVDVTFIHSFTIISTRFKQQLAASCVRTYVCQWLIELLAHSATLYIISIISTHDSPHLWFKFFLTLVLYLIFYIHFLHTVHSVHGVSESSWGCQSSLITHQSSLSSSRLSDDTAQLRTQLIYTLCTHILNDTMCVQCVCVYTMCVYTHSVYTMCVHTMCVYVWCTLGQRLNKWTNADDDDGDGDDGRRQRCDHRWF